MLSRAAESLYHLGRQLQRADHTARWLDVHHGLWLDRTAGPNARFWPDFVTMLGFRRPARLTPAEATALVLSDLSGPSVRNALSSARRAALAFRPSLSTEVYEQVNVVYWQLEEADRKQDLHGTLSRVQLGVQLAFGLIEETMAHDEAWDFVLLGKYLQRAAAVNTLLMTKLPALARGGDDPVESAAVLKCALAFESYRQRYSAPVTPAGIATFLLLDRTFPRSSGFCVRRAAEAIERIDGPGHRSRPRRLIGELAALFDGADQAEVAAAPEVFGSAFAALVRRVDESLAGTYFHPSRIAAAGTAEFTVWAMPQQQQ
ncbi:MAG: hypothetical protein QOK05_2008 [Chloroflexota bacterium]|jgi:uncharacterized alpha-E superfamily protein|nr:hypothetical protein [Chloroflexota bacterium]